MPDQAMQARGEGLPVVHIGANKAASTTLQASLFARHPEVYNLGKPSPDVDAEQAIDAILLACDRRYDMPSLDKGLVDKRWNAVIGRSAEAGRLPVFSREKLIRDWFYRDPDPERLPRMLTAVTGPVRVVMVVRHQLHLIESLYLHKSKSSHYLPLERWLEDDPEDIRSYRFYEIAAAWASVVGEQNVGVFVFEDLVSDVQSFARRLCGFMGIDQNIGVALLSGRHDNIRRSNRVHTYARLRARLFPSVSFGKLLPSSVRTAWRQHLVEGPRAQIEWPAHWVSRIKDFYAADNRKLAERFQLPLQSYGYPM